MVSWTLEGGMTPIMTSLIIPPPIAVVRPKTMTPSRSICFFIANAEPDTAKAIVPNISIAKINKLFLPLLNPENLYNYLIY